MLSYFYGIREEFKFKLSYKIAWIAESNERN